MFRRRPGVRPGLALWLVALVAVNMRPAVVNVGPVLPDVLVDLGADERWGGLFTALPMVVFAIGAACSITLTRAIGAYPAIALALVAVGVGNAGRSFTDSAPAFAAMSVAAVGGVAALNVLTPLLVRATQSPRVPQVTTSYVTLMSVSQCAAAGLTAPIAVLGPGSGAGWRVALGFWSLPTVPALGLCVWLWARSTTADRASAPNVSLWACRRSGLAWAIALFLGLQSLQAFSLYGWLPAMFRDAGVPSTHAGLLLGVVTLLAIPGSIIVPRLLGSGRDVRVLTILASCYPVAYFGLLFAPREGALAWTLLAGLAGWGFPAALTMIGLRAATAAGTAALAAFAQAVGYALAATGPFGFGWLHATTGSYTPGLLALSSLAIIQWLIATRIAGTGSIEAKLPVEPRHRRPRCRPGQGRRWSFATRSCGDSMKGS